MTKQKSKGLNKLLLVIILVSIPLIFIALFAGSYLFSKANQISKTEADQKCYQFAKGVKSDISSVQGHTAVSEDVSCNPNQDEAGFTDYQFIASFKVTKDDNASAESQKANINNLAKTLPLKNYNISISNIPATDGQPPTICVSASTLIQEDGSIYNSAPPQNTPTYYEPGAVSEYPPCRNVP